MALVGPTATGKSQLAFDYARARGDIEILSIDSMAVYRHMDIATAKPTKAEQRVVRYHLIDLTEPSERFTVADFVDAAKCALATIAQRGHRALFVGGSGLYVRAVIDGFEIPPQFPALAADLEAQADSPGGLDVLFARLEALDPLAASRVTKENRRRIVRALEVIAGTGRLFSDFGAGLTNYASVPVGHVGLPIPDDLDTRIEERFARFLDDGLVAEVQRLTTLPGGLSRTARQAIGYRELLAHVEDGEDLDACVAEAIVATKQFVRRQWSWFKRDPRIHWIGPDEEPFAVLDCAYDQASALGAR